jgi:hypothetical protein
MRVISNFELYTRYGKNPEPDFLVNMPLRGVFIESLLDNTPGAYFPSGELFHEAKKSLIFSYF